MDVLEKKEEVLPKEPEDRLFWQVRVEYSNHTVQDISCYDDYLPESPEELYFPLLEYFEPEGNDFW